MSCVTWDLLAADLVGWASDPVDGELGGVSEDVLVHLGTGWEVDSSLHALLEGNAAHVLFIAAGLADFLIYSAGSFAEQVVLKRNVSSVAWEVLTGPHAGLLGVVLRGLRSLFAHF